MFGKGDDTGWYYRPSTGEVMQGKQRGWEDRMGPYASREEAQQAMKLVSQRNEAADDWGDDGWDDDED